MSKRLKLKDFEEAPISDFFEGEELEEAPIKRRNIFVNLFYFVIASALVGGLMMIPMVSLGMITVQAADPVTKAWSVVPGELPDVAIAQKNTIYDKNGGVIAQIWSQNRTQVKSLDDVSPYLVKGLVDTEDKNFYVNKGFNPTGIARAVLRGSGGGSGITQQLVKNLQYYNLLGKEDDKAAAVAQTYTRKVREIKQAVEYEKKHSKNEILLNYFNTVAFGGPSVYGIETASQYFYGKHAKDLNLAESAALIGTENNPVIFSMESNSNITAWKNRQKVVLDAMVNNGTIKQSEADAAYKVNLKLLRKSSGGGTCANSKYPFYCYYTLSYLKSSTRLGSTAQERQEIIDKGGLEIKTYMDPAVVKTTEDYLSKNWGNTNRIVAPTAVVQPGTGGVVSIAANRKLGNGKGETEMNLATTATGEGSVYKMFTLAAAANNGWTEDKLAFSSKCPLYPGSAYDSPPRGYRNSVSCSFQGGYKNYKEATALSSNTWFVTLEMKVGVEKVKEFSKQVGLSAPDYITPRSLSYTLGSVPNSPVKLAAAFATFANKGVYCPPTPISSLKYTDGSSPAYPDGYDPKVDSCRSVMTPKAASIVAKAMRADVSSEIKYAFGAKANIPGIDNGGKSGTNELLNSSWAQITGYYSLFTNVYDKDKQNRGIDGAVFKGYAHPWTENTAQETGSDIMKILHRGKKNIPLPFNATEEDKIEIPIDESQFIAVPSVVGMSPGDALNTLKSLGIQAEVSKVTKEAPAGYSSGVVVEQSVKANERLTKGSKKIIVLYLSP